MSKNSTNFIPSFIWIGVSEADRIYFHRYIKFTWIYLALSSSNMITKTNEARAANTSQPPSLDNKWQNFTHKVKRAIQSLPIH